MKKSTEKYIIENIQDLIEYGDVGFEKSIVGTASEQRALTHLKTLGYEIQRHANPDAGGHPDFVLKWKGKGYLIEHKRASKNKYADGSLRLEFQKTRTSKGDPSSRFYSINWCNIVSIDVSEHTEVPNDKMFVLATELEKHEQYPKKIKAIHKQSEYWCNDLEEVLEKVQ